MNMAKTSRALTGKVVAITGAGRGIGRQTAAALIAEGARVAIGDIDVRLAENTAAELGGGSVGLALDVTSTDSFDAFLSTAEDQLGALDVLINNAGIMPLGPLVDEREEVTRVLVDINLHGVIIGTKLALKRFGPRDSGAIVNIASAAGKIGFPGGATYSATKHAVMGLTEAVRGELRGTGVEVHVICPMVVNTELGSGLTKVRGFGELEPADVADAVLACLKGGRYETTVPGSLGPVLALGRLLPHSWFDWLLRCFRGDRVLSDTDPTARAAYEARILPAGTESQAQSIADVAASVASAIDD
jgi:NAD(P)-dependent dehydrogenase (short-subunit alcohol dehydrogenase family)